MIPSDNSRRSVIGSHVDVVVSRTDSESRATWEQVFRGYVWSDTTNDGLVLGSCPEDSEPDGRDFLTIHGIAWHLIEEVSRVDEVEDSFE